MNKNQIQNTLINDTYQALNQDKKVKIAKSEVELVINSFLENIKSSLIKDKDIKLEGLSLL